MTITDQQQRALAYIAAATRPPRAPKWDEPGIVAAIAKVAHLSLADVAMATVRAAADEHAKTPGVIANTSSSYWREKATPSTVPHPPKPGDACRVCGKALEDCNPLTCGKRATRAEPKTSSYSDRAAECKAALRGNNTTKGNA